MGGPGGPDGAWAASPAGVSQVPRTVAQGRGLHPLCPFNKQGSTNLSQQGPLQPSVELGRAAGMHQRDKGARHSQSQGTRGLPWVCGPPELSHQASSPLQGHTPCHTHRQPQSGSWLPPRHRGGAAKSGLTWITTRGDCEKYQSGIPKRLMSAVLVSYVSEQRVLRMLPP